MESIEDLAAALRQVAYNEGQWAHVVTHVSLAIMQLSLSQPVAISCCLLTLHLHLAVAYIIDGYDTWVMYVSPVDRIRNDIHELQYRIGDSCGRTFGRKLTGTHGLSSTS